MAKVLNEGDELRVKIETEDDEKDWPVLILKMPSDKAIEEFETKRVEIEFGRHGKTKTKIDHAADARFVEGCLIGCENIQVRLNGEYVALDPLQHEDWKLRIPTRWKRKAAGVFLTGEAQEQAEKNS